MGTSRTRIRSWPAIAALPAVGRTVVVMPGILGKGFAGLRSVAR